MCIRDINLPLEYVVGKQWSSRFEIVAPNGQRGEATWNFKITRKETIQIGAGSFDAYRMEGNGGNTLGHLSKRTLWLAPERSRVPLAHEETTQWFGRIIVAERIELLESSAIT